jgi:hypothetical protein
MEPRMDTDAHGLRVRTGGWGLGTRGARLTWRIPHEGVSYIEYRMHLDARAVQKRARTP